MVKKNTSSSIPEEDDAVAADLVGALAAHQFFLVYQPTIDLQTGAFAGVESLIRWRHPVRGVVAPDHFIAELESSGDIVPVGRWALHTACAQGALWHAKGYRFTVAVNIARGQFDRDEFVAEVSSALDDSRFDPSLLVLELSQSTLVNGGPETARRLEHLAALGVRVAVDDFALGQSSLDDLLHSPVQIVKLNRLSIEGIKGSNKVATLVHELVVRAKALGVQIIASGIEDVEQRERLQDEQVSVGQGFLFSRPHEAADIDRFLEDFALFSGQPL